MSGRARVDDADRVVIRSSMVVAVLWGRDRCGHLVRECKTWCANLMFFFLSKAWMLSYSWVGAVQYRYSSAVPYQFQLQSWNNDLEQCCSEVNYIPVGNWGFWFIHFILNIRL